MRAPDGHDGGGAGDTGGAAADAGGGADASGNSADGGGDAGGADQGGGGGADSSAGAEGGADQGDAGKPGTILGEAASGDAAEGDKGGEGEGGKEGDKEGKEGKEGEGGDAPLEVLGAPEKYDMKVPEALAATGVTFDQEAFDAVEPVFRGMNLSNEAVQQVVDAYAGTVLPLIEKRAGDRMDAGSADMRRGWEAEARADPDIGGNKFDETKALARQTFIKFGVKSDGPFLKLLEESGLGSHPDMLRFVAGVGRSTGEATVDTSGSGQQATRLADRVYGKPTPRE